MAGNLIPFDSTGIDFAMTALFLVIFTEQWESAKSHVPAVLGVAFTVICRLIFGADWFIPLSMACILVSLTFYRKKEASL